MLITTQRTSKTSSRLRLPVYNHILEPETFDAAGRDFSCCSTTSKSLKEMLLISV